jgi:RNA polymerase sigma factor (sigma-70 family)
VQSARILWGFGVRAALAKGARPRIESAGFLRRVMSIFQEQPDLLGAFRQGERWALERVYRAHVRMLDGYLRTLARAGKARDLSQPSAIADSLQEVFIRAFAPGARNAYDSTRPYAPYLRKIAKNLFIDQLRARGSRLEELVETLPDTSEAAPAEGEASADPLVSSVLSAYLAALPPPLLGVYEQRFVLGNSQETACSALGVTRRRLRTDEERLKSGLRRALVSHGILRGDLSAAVALTRTLGIHALR